jgi:hypothetical protein
MTRLEELTLEIAAELVEGREVADLVMDERARVGASVEEWRDYQRFKIELAASGIEAALILLAAARTGAADSHELDRLTHRLAVGFMRLARRREAVFDEELRDVADGGDGSEAPAG